MARRTCVKRDIPEGWEMLVLIPRNAARVPVPKMTTMAKTFSFLNADSTERRDLWPGLTVNLARFENAEEWRTFVAETRRRMAELEPPYCDVLKITEGNGQITSLMPCPSETWILENLGDRKAARVGYDGTVKATYPKVAPPTGPRDEQPRKRKPGPEPGYAEGATLEGLVYDMLCEDQKPRPMEIFKRLHREKVRRGLEIKVYEHPDDTRLVPSSSAKRALRKARERYKAERKGQN
jgi:hypothetical protein